MTRTDDEYAFLKSALPSEDRGLRQGFICCKDSGARCCRLEGLTMSPRAVRNDGDTAITPEFHDHPLFINSMGRLKVASTPGSYAPVVGVVSAVGNTLVANTNNASNAMLYVTGVFSAANVTFEGSIDDGVSWFGIQAVRSNANTVETATGSLSAAPAYAWELSVNALTHVRVRVTAITSGSQTWRIVLGSYATEPIPAIQTATMNAIGSVAALSQYSLTGAASTNAAVVVSSSRKLFNITIFNPTAAVVYVKFYNKATAPTVGTDIPVMTIPVGVNEFVSYDWGRMGKLFSTAIAMAITAGPLATDTAAVAAGVQVHGSYSASVTS